MFVYLYLPFFRLVQEIGEGYGFNLLHSANVRNLMMMMLMKAMVAMVMMKLVDKHDKNEVSPKFTLINAIMISFT